MTFVRPGTWTSLTDSQVHELSDRLLAEAEALLEHGWWGQPLSYDVEGLQELAAAYPCVEARCRRDPDFAERFELVVAAWKDRPAG